jgi:hypothetical protein
LMALQNTHRFTMRLKTAQPPHYQGAQPGVGLQ